MSSIIRTGGSIWTLSFCLLVASPLLLSCYAFAPNGGGGPAVGVKDTSSLFISSSSSFVVSPLIVGKNRDVNRMMVHRHPSSLALAASSDDKDEDEEKDDDVVVASEESDVAVTSEESEEEDVVLSVASTTTTSEEVVIPSDYRLGIEFVLIGLLLDQIPYVQWVLGLPVTLLGILFAVQASRVRFVFTDDNFELRSGGEDGEVGENIVVGGENVWAYDSFVNWEFFPKGWIDQPQGPILAYFKENQTPEEMWNTGAGQLDNNEEKLRLGEVKPGQVHFFPAICNAQMLRTEFQKRGCTKLN